LRVAVVGGAVVGIAAAATAVVVGFVGICGTDAAVIATVGVDDNNTPLEAFCATLVITVLG